MEDLKTSRLFKDFWFLVLVTRLVSNNTCGHIDNWKKKHFFSFSIDINLSSSQKLFKILIKINNWNLQMKSNLKWFFEITTITSYTCGYILWFSDAFSFCSKSVSKIAYIGPVIVVGAVITHKMFDGGTKYHSHIKTNWY